MYWFELVQTEKWWGWRNCSLGFELNFFSKFFCSWTGEVRELKTIIIFYWVLLLFKFKISIIIESNLIQLTISYTKFEWRSFINTQKQGNNLESHASSQTLNLCQHLYFHLSQRKKTKDMFFVIQILSNLTIWLNIQHIM